MKFLQGIKARLADGAAAPLSRSSGITSDATEDANTTTNDCNDPRPLLKLGPFAFPSSSSYPSLYGEANDMISLSNLIYVLVDVRDLARNGTNNGSTAAVLGESSAERILNTPLPLADVARIVTAEADALKARLNAETHAATLAALAGLTTTTKATSTGITTTTTTMNGETLKGETAANNSNNNNNGGLFNLFIVGVASVLVLAVVVIPPCSIPTKAQSRRVVAMAVNHYSHRQS